ncbi:MAG: hypothetical protein PHH61_06450 [Candidatus Nanoarchaeia archaeon]|nr:hypothetical protein [Candidatus Nanoarchaeia archaeon]
MASDESTRGFTEALEIVFKIHMVITCKSKENEERCVVCPIIEELKELYVNANDLKLKQIAQNYGYNLGV